MDYDNPFPRLPSDPPPYVQAAITGVGSLIGVAVVFWVFDSMPIPGAEPKLALSIVFAAIAIGAIAGGWFASLASKW